VKTGKAVAESEGVGVGGVCVKVTEGVALRKGVSRGGGVSARSGVVDAGAGVRAAEHAASMLKAKTAPANRKNFMEDILMRSLPESREDWPVGLGRVSGKMGKCSSLGKE
jgi:hypothetical protein